MERSEIMRRVRSKGTRPEMAVRKALHALGYRFRLYGTKLPGSPDIVFPSRKTVIFVHGCFWHRHSKCSRATTPKTRTEYWQEKFVKNVARDIAVQASLAAIGWKVHVIWECELKKDLHWLDVTVALLGPPGRIKSERVK